MKKLMVFLVLLVGLVMMASGVLLTVFVNARGAIAVGIILVVFGIRLLIFWLIFIAIDMIERDK